MRARRSWLFALLTAGIAVALSLAAAELLLRVAGRGPWSPPPPRPHEAVLFDPDPVRGWQPRPGRHEFPGRPGDRRSVVVTQAADGSRATAAEPVASGPVWVLVGGSFAQGWGLSDEETLAWRLQARWPGRRVRNHAVGGYGSYQSLLTLEELFAGDEPPDQVLYGFAEIHEERNVAAPRWLRSLALTSRSGMAAVPYVTLEGPRLVRHPPSAYPAWPARTLSATVTFLQDLAASRAGAARAAAARPATERLLLEMQDVALRHGARLAVVLLDLSPAGRAHYLRFLRLQRLEAVDCALPIPLSRRLPEDGHPNAAHQRDWEACVAAALGSAA